MATCIASIFKQISQQRILFLTSSAPCLNYIKSGIHLLTVLTFLDIIAVAAFMFLAFLNIEVYKDVAKRLNEIGGNTNEVTRLQDELQDLFEQAERAYEKLSE